MRVILLKDVAKIGRRLAVVEVPDGFARNKLIPGKAAVPATKEALARYRAEGARVAAVKAAAASEVSAALAKLTDTPVMVTASANAQGHLFKAVTKDMIVDAAASAGAQLPAAALTITAPIKSLGKHIVAVRQGSTVGEITVEVVASD
jgi:large subunit ribosomal protein L9